MYVSDVAATVLSIGALVAACGSSGCSDSRPGEEVATEIPAPATPAAREAAVEEGENVLAMDVFAQGQIVDLLLFEETAEGTKELRHRRSRDGAATWSTSRTIDRAGRDIVGHHRGMDPQIAAHGDTLVVLWTQPGESPWGTGTLATAVSTDAGQTWIAGADPSDMGSALGHGFLDLAADTSGVFTAVWLDDRDGAQGLRSTISRDGGRSWLRDVSIDRRTCECCWNKATALSPGSFAVLYRDRDPRDMALAVSHDDAVTWTRRGFVGRFGWEIEACPHVGGGLASTVAGPSRTFHAAVWTGAEDALGVHVFRSRDGGRSWTPSVRMGSERARNSDIAARESNVVVAWDQFGEGHTAIFAATSRDHGASWNQRVRLSRPKWTATHPLVVSTGDAFVVFWTERRAGQNEPVRWSSTILRADGDSGAP